MIQNAPFIIRTIKDDCITAAYQILPGINVIDSLLLAVCLINRQIAISIFIICSTLVSGQGTTTIVVNWGSINGVITCKANNGCGSSIAGQKPVAFTCKEIGSVFEFSEINLNPNPASSSVTVQFDAFAEGDAQLYIYDLIGQKMLEEKLSVLNGNNQYTINLNNYPKGTYMVKVVYSGNERNSKLIVN